MGERIHENYKRGLPYITGLLILNDVETGLPLAVMDCVWITAMRTGAATALSARYLARAESSVVGILGCGVQGRTNLEALKVLFPVRRGHGLRYGSGNRSAIREGDGVPIRHRGCSGAEAERGGIGCDMVVTAGPILKKPHQTIQPGWMAEGAFASLVDFDSYWHPDAMKQASKFCTDDTEQLLHYRQVGYFRTSRRSMRTSESL